MKEIKYPVSVGQEPEGEPDAETMTVLRDATGRDLDVEEVAAALNAFASSHELRTGNSERGASDRRAEDGLTPSSPPSTPVDTSCGQIRIDEQPCSDTLCAFVPSTTPRSETPRTAAIARKWSLKGGGTNTSDASPEAKELYGHAEQLEHELRKLAAEYADLKVYGRTTASATRHMDPRPCMAPICGTTCGYPEDHQIHEGSTKPAPPHGRHAYQPSAPTGAET